MEFLRRRIGTPTRLRAAGFDEMSDLAKSLRGKLAGVAEIRPLPVLTEQASADGTVKWLFDVGAGDAVETVFIPEDDRGTLCISSQAGCAMGCVFCATGQMGYLRHLTPGEIVAQAVHVARALRTVAGSPSSTPRRSASAGLMRTVRPSGPRGAT